MSDTNMMTAELYALPEDGAKLFTEATRDGAKSRRSTQKVVDYCRDNCIPSSACYAPSYEGDDCTSSVEFRESLLVCVLVPLTKLQRQSYDATPGEARLMTKPQKAARKEAQKHVKDTLNSLRQALVRRERYDVAVAEAERQEGLREAAQAGDADAKAELDALLAAEDAKAFTATEEVFQGMVKRFQNAEHGPLAERAAVAVEAAAAFATIVGFEMPTE